MCGLKIAFGNFTIFTALVQFAIRVNWFDFEVKGSKFKVTARPNVVRKGTLGILKVMGTKVNSVSGEGILLTCLLINTLLTYQPLAIS